MNPLFIGIPTRDGQMLIHSNFELFSLGKMLDRLLRFLFGEAGKPGTIVLHLSLHGLLSIGPIANHDPFLDRPFLEIRPLLTLPSRPSESDHF